MRGPWLPRARWGESSDYMPGTSEGTEGWYLQVGWLGWMVSAGFGSVARSETWLERYDRKQAEKRAQEAIRQLGPGVEVKRAWVDNKEIDL